MVPKGGVSLFCPHCGKHTAVSPAPLSILGAGPSGPSAHRITEWINQDPYYDDGNWWMGMCNACRQPLLVKGVGSKVFPAPQPGPVSEHVPDPMASDLREAKQCLAANAWNAAVVMARRALQCAAVEQGAPSGKLATQIKWLDDNRKITTAQRQWADAARWVGNHGAHDTEPNVAEGQPVITNVTEEDARATVELVDHLFETLYVASQIAREQLTKRGKLPENS